MDYSAKGDALAGSPGQAGSGNVADRDAAIGVALDLLARTVELPGSRRELLAVLGEYRSTLHFLAAAAAPPTPAR